MVRRTLCAWDSETNRPIALVLIWTIVCLAIAVHLQNILVSSDLSA